MMKRKAARYPGWSATRVIATISVVGVISFRLSATWGMMREYLLEIAEPPSLYTNVGRSSNSNHANMMDDEPMIGGLGDLPDGKLNTSAAKIAKAAKKAAKAASLDAHHHHHTNSTNHSTDDSEDDPTRDGDEIAPSEDELPPPQPHPHAGARSANGSWGYVADVYRVRNLMIVEYLTARSNRTRNDIPISYLPFESSKELDEVCNTPPREGTEKEAGYAIIATKVHVNSSIPINNNLNHNYTNMKKATTTKEPLRILCAMYTYEDGHFRLPGVRDTWAWRCDGFFAASTKTVDDPADEGFGAIDLPHMGKEDYLNMWQKVRSIWSYMYDNYLEDFDYFYLCGDDTHLIVENLRNYLTSIHNPEYPAYLGHTVVTNSSMFVGGGPGYVLNRKALKILVEDVFPVCKAKTLTSAEDLYMSNCFRDTAGIEGNHTVDAFGAQRFHGMGPQFIAVYNATQGFYRRTYKFWGERYGGYRMGIDLVSTQSVSFHMLKRPLKMKRHHAIIYRSCPRSTVLGGALLAS